MLYKERRKFSKFEAWIDILMEVQHKDEPQQIIIGNKVLSCNKGESLKSVGTWASRWRWTNSKVKRFFKTLQKSKQIELKNESITTRLKVCNYEIYNDKRTANEPQADRMRTGCGPDADTDNNVKNDKNGNNTAINADALQTHCVSNASKVKKKHLDSVFLSDEEYRILGEKLGDINRKKYIENLDCYIGSKGKKYKSHYKTILAWWHKDGDPVSGKNLEYKGAKPTCEDVIK